MIKTILKHYIFDRFLNSIFSNLESVFISSTLDIKVGDVFSYIQLSHHYNDYKAIECTTSLMDCKVTRITDNYITVSHRSGYLSYRYESIAIANKMYFNYNIPNSMLDDNKIIVRDDYMFCYFTPNRIIQIG